MIRRLTTEEINQVNTAKQTANTKLNDMRSALRTRKRHLSRVDRVNLENRLAALKAVTGKPVVVAVGGIEIVLDYELLSKFLRSLEKHRFWYTLQVNGNEFDRKLIVEYQQGYSGQHGTLTLFELSPRQRDLLERLPRVELER